MFQAIVPEKKFLNCHIVDLEDLFTIIVKSMKVHYLPFLNRFCLKLVIQLCLFLLLVLMIDQTMHHLKLSQVVFYHYREAELEYRFQELLL